jgi:predicted nucleic acid-binding protein
VVTGAYLDASALVKLVVRERETDSLRALLKIHPRRFTNRVAVVEVARAVGRRETAREAPVEAAFEGVEVIDLDEGIAAHARSIGPPSLRSLDAIHLASALALGPELDAFVTYDSRQADAARALGLNVEAPS